MTFLLSCLLMAEGTPTDNPYNMSTVISLQQGLQSNINSKLVARVDLPMMGEMTGHGSTPLHLSAHNPDSSPHELELSCQWDGQEVLSYLESLEPNQTIEQEWVIPAVECSYCRLECDVFIDDKRQSTSMDVWSEPWQNNASGFILSSPIVFLGDRSSFQQYPEWYLPIDRIIEKDKVMLVPDPIVLPNHGAGYLSAGRVVWFTESIELSKSQQEALKDWVVLGGHLIIVGDDSMAQTPTWSDWTKPAFAYNAPSLYPASSRRSKEVKGVQDTLYQGDVLNIIQQIEMRSDDASVRTWHTGLGNLTMVPGTISPREVASLVLSEFYEQNGIYFTSGRSEQGFDLVDSESTNVSLDKSEASAFQNDEMPTFSGSFQMSNTNDVLLQTGDQKRWLKDEQFQLLSPSVIVGLSFVLCVLLGPVNMLMRGSRLNLLWRTPFLGTIALLLVLGVESILNRANVLGQGFDMVVLDQRSNQLLALKRRLVLPTKSYPSMLAFTPHTKILPQRIVSKDQVASKIITSEEGTALRDGILHRNIQGQLIWNQATQRRGLRFENGAVQNDLDVSIDRVIMRDGTGQYWAVRDVAKGASATLKTATRDALYFKEPLWRENILWWEDIPKGTYLFVTSDRVEWDFMQDDYDKVDPIDEEIANRKTLVYGVLP